MVESVLPEKLLSQGALDGEVHVYHLNLADFSAEVLPRALALLDPEENERAERLRHGSARQAFVFVRSALRVLLGSYLRQPPASLRFEQGRKGKPRLVGSESDCSTTFNVSHSGDFGLIALSRETDLGVDVEKTREVVNLERLAERCLTDGELAYWRSLPGENRQQRFFDLWCFKEAFAKATGEGIGMGLNGIDVMTSERLVRAIDGRREALMDARACQQGDSAFNEPRLVAVPVGFGSPDEWRVAEINCEEGYRAALCYRGARRRVCLADGKSTMNVLLNMPYFG